VVKVKMKAKQVSLRGEEAGDRGRRIKDKKGRGWLRVEVSRFLTNADRIIIFATCWLPR
jgi:hypothetical protein